MQEDGCLERNVSVGVMEMEEDNKEEEKYNSLYTINETLKK